MTHQEALEQPGTYATVLLTAAWDLYGAEMLEWDPTALSYQLEQDQSVQLPQGNADRLHAASAALVSDAFHRSLEAFTTMCNTMSFVPVRSEWFVPASLESCLWGCSETRLLQGRELYQSQKFSPEIAGYVGVLMDREGMRTKPAALKFAVLPDPAEDMADLLSDPLTHQAYYDSQEQRVARLERAGLEHYQRMLQQLQQLELRHGSSKPVDRMLEQLQKISP